MPENLPSSEHREKYTYAQELLDMLRVAYRRYSCNCHHAEIERFLKHEHDDHVHQNFFRMVDKADHNHCELVAEREKVKMLREALRQVKEQVVNCDAPCAHHCQGYVERALAAIAGKDEEGERG